jgi:hypothetical protein
VGVRVDQETEIGMTVRVDESRTNNKIRSIALLFKMKNLMN